MTINFTRGQRLVAFLCLAGVLLCTPRARADQGDPPEVEAQRLVHILGYIGADYGGSVANGVVTVPDEYNEQLSLAADGAKIAARIQPAIPPGREVDVPARIAKLRELLDRKAPPEEVAALIAGLRTELVNAFQIEEAPRAAPNAARGKGLYLEHCATCHGETGRADTARAATFTPRPVNFHDPERGEAIAPYRVVSTVRFGVDGTAMVPFTFLSDADRWDLAFHVVGLRHQGVAPAPADSVPAYTLAELSARTDADLRAELKAAGVPADREAAALADLRLRAPYEDRAARTPLGLVRVKLERARKAVARGDRDGARGHLIDAYLEGIEPIEAPLRAADASLAAALEARSMELRGDLERGASPAELGAAMDVLLRDVGRAESLLSPSSAPKSFASTALSSAGILLREGVEAALLIAALLGIASQAGLADRRRYVHVGWVTAIALGLLTWFASARLVAISGAQRELIEGVTALLATAVLFYVSYSLLAKREVARWMKFLKEQISPRRAALSLFGVSLLAAYREAFETVLFYQALLASNASATAALVGAAAGALVLVALVAAYSRAGRFAPPQVFFRVSSYLLYALAIIFAGQGVAALQMAGKVPVHALPFRGVPALGVFPTVETLAAQLLLVLLAVVGVLAQRRQANAAPKPPAPPAQIAPGSAA
ncbi:FTR1 family protein [Sorangium sp. So ce131]|uniref:FTR1 family protein n=1 Tax=Sorangium sp. So ce131 TaxID=3133282 RepID=UPI003F6466DB